MVNLINELEGNEKNDVDEISDLQQLLSMGNTTLQNLEDRLLKKDDDFYSDSSDLENNDEQPVNDYVDNDFAEESFEESYDSIDSDLVEAVENTRQLTQAAKDVVYAKEKDTTNDELESLLVCIDELENFVPKMIEDVPKIKSKNEQNKENYLINESKVTNENDTDVIANFKQNQKIGPMLSSVVEKIPESSASRIKKNNSILKDAVNNPKVIEDNDFENLLNDLMKDSKNYLSNRGEVDGFFLKFIRFSFNSKF